MGPIKLNVVVYEDGELLVAQAIEVDIAARAPTIDDLPRALERALVANLATNAKMGRVGLDGIGPAPPRFQEMFKRASSRALADKLDKMRPPAGVKIDDMRLVAA